jgi:hypothetical protein
MNEEFIDLDDAGPGVPWAQPDEWPNFDQPGPLFEEDTGTLPVEVRRTMVSILKKRYISAAQNPAAWRVLLDNEEQLRSRFHDLFLNLVVDRHYRVAYKRQAQPDGGVQPFPTVLFEQSYTREETILLVKLRMLLRGSHPDDPVFVDRSDLLDELSNFRAPDVTKLLTAEKTERKAVERLEAQNLLLATQDNDRLQVAPIIEVLMPVARLLELYTWLSNARGVVPPAETAEATPSDESTPDPDNEEEL